MGIDLTDVIAIGDNLNDISMLERVGYPVAMNNATELNILLNMSQTPMKIVELESNHENIKRK